MAPVFSGVELSVNLIPIKSYIQLMKFNSKNTNTQHVRNKKEKYRIFVKNAVCKRNMIWVCFKIT